LCCTFDLNGKLDTDQGSEDGVSPKVATEPFPDSVKDGASLSVCGDASVS
jgi:hypothetical protein